MKEKLLILITSGRVPEKKPKPYSLTRLVKNVWFLALAKLSEEDELAVEEIINRQLNYFRYCAIPGKRSSHKADFIIENLDKIRPHFHLLEKALKKLR